jgi:fatty-acyl-CoA synthase
MNSITQAKSPIYATQTLGDLLRRSRLRYPKKIAVQCNTVQWTYSEFDDICNRLAQGLAAQNVAIGDRVAVIARNSHAFAALRFAVARLGAVLVPINYMLSVEDAHFILGHSGASILCVDTEFANLGHQASTSTDIKKLLWMPGENTSAPDQSMLNFSDLLLDPVPVERHLDGAMLAQIIYTSGTESKPKGAMLTHSAIIAEYVTCLVDVEIAEKDIALHALPLYHCAQLDVFFGPAIYVGSTNHITGIPTADNLLKLLSSNKITSFFAPPTIWIALLRSPDFDKTDLTALEKGYYGASIMPVEVLKEIQRRLPKVRLWNLYGQTEIAPMATVLKPEDQLRKAGSAGRAALNIETRVVDDAMNDVKVGDIGEIVHRSPQLLSGYYKDEARTAEAFAGGWFHSGDLGVIDDEGYITVVDRKKDMIKTGGENVASREVEEAIYGIEGVSEVAVIGVPDAKWIEAVTAVIVIKTGYALTEGMVHSECAMRLSKFKAPKHIVFIDALPKNPSGKVLKRELRLRIKLPQ